MHGRIPFAVVAACLALLVASGAVPAAGRLPSCGTVRGHVFRAKIGFAGGVSCRTARRLVKRWLNRSHMTPFDGAPFSKRRGQWRCVTLESEVCTLNGHRARLGYAGFWRYRTDLWAFIRSDVSSDSSGATIVDYRVGVSNPGKDAGKATLRITLSEDPSSHVASPGMSVVSVTASQGTCAAPNARHQVVCSLGRVRHFDYPNGPSVDVRLRFDCGPSGRFSAFADSSTSDLDWTNNGPSDDLGPASDCIPG
jgi:hypothetical protein